MPALRALSSPIGEELRHIRLLPHPPPSPREGGKEHLKSLPLPYTAATFEMWARMGAFSLGAGQSGGSGGHSSKCNVLPWLASKEIRRRPSTPRGGRRGHAARPTYRHHSKLGHNLPAAAIGPAQSFDPLSLVKHFCLLPGRWRFTPDYTSSDGFLLSLLRPQSRFMPSSSSASFRKAEITLSSRRTTTKGSPEGPRLELATMYWPWAPLGRATTPGPEFEAADDNTASLEYGRVVEFASGGCVPFARRDGPADPQAGRP